MTGGRQAGGTARPPRGGTAAPRGDGAGARAAPFGPRTREGVMGANVLVVEDEPAMREMVARDLREAGYEVVEAGDAPGAWRALRASRVDLMVLDWMLPGASGYELLRRLRREGHPTERERDLPVIVVTARAAEPDRIRGLDAGADDYVTKPFSPRELRARVRALLRRTAEPRSDRIEAGGLVIDRDRCRVSAGGVEIGLGPTEFRLLHFLASHPDRVYSRARILDNAWGRDAFIEERTVDVQVRRVRKALAPHGFDGCIQTVRGFGYRFATSRG